MTPRPAGGGGLEVRHGDAAFRAQVEADGTVTVTPGDARLQVSRVTADTYRVTAGGDSWHVVVWRSGGRCQAFVDGVVFELEVGPGARRRRRAGHAGALAAPMPARVREVRVTVGQEVAAGEVLVTLEAMKMELAVRAPRAGRVSAISCREGEMVAQGIALLELAGDVASEDGERKVENGGSRSAAASQEP
ncbi:MAG: 3-methylcrotonyl-CoA carboxylase [Acidobacteria bacterium]|nr:3-methylcrotonyl-CoA carboxylase [Acidobacteriota bacterium]